MEGDVSLESFFDTLDARVTAQVWTMRIFCLLLFLISPYLVLQPIALAPERVPCVGQVRGRGRGRATGRGRCSGRGKVRGPYSAT